MDRFIRKPSIDMVAGVRVTKNTRIEFSNEFVSQSLKNLVFHSVTKVKGDNYKSSYNTTIYLKEGDVLVFEEDSRGYIKPVEEFVSVEEAIAELECIKDLK